MKNKVQKLKNKQINYLKMRILLVHINYIKKH